MGACISFLICAIVEASITACEVTADVLAGVAGEILGEIVGESVESAAETIIDSVIDDVGDETGSYSEYVEDAGEDATKEAEEAEEEARNILKQVCDEANRVVSDAKKLEDSTTKLMDGALILHKTVKDVHDCGISVSERQVAVAKVNQIRNAFTAQNIRASTEDKMKDEGKQIGKSLLKKGLEKVFGSGIDGCFDAADGAANLKVKSFAEKAQRDGSKLIRMISRQAQQLQCTQHDGVGTKHIKCPSNTNGGKNTAHHGEAACSSSRSRTNASVTELSTTGYMWPIPYPVEVLCGSTGFVSVSTFEEAVSCHRQVLRDMSFDWSQSPHWDHIVSRGACNAVLFAASEDPTDSFCTVVRTAQATNALYETNAHGGNRGHYTEVPHCTSVEQATYSMLHAMTNARPEFDLIRFVYTPSHINCTDAIGVHRVHISGPQMNLPSQSFSSTLTPTQHSMLLAVLVIVSVQLGSFLLRLLWRFIRIFEISVVSSPDPKVPVSATNIQGEIELGSASSTR